MEIVYHVYFRTLPTSLKRSRQVTNILIFGITGNTVKTTWFWLKETVLPLIYQLLAREMISNRMNLIFF